MQDTSGLFGVMDYVWMILSDSLGQFEKTADRLKMEISSWWPQTVENWLENVRMRRGGGDVRSELGKSGDYAILGDQRDNRGIMKAFGGEEEKDNRTGNDKSRRIKKGGDEEKVEKRRRKKKRGGEYITIE